MAAMLFIVYNTFEFKVFVASIRVGPIVGNLYKKKHALVQDNTHASTKKKTLSRKHALIHEKKNFLN